MKKVLILGAGLIARPIIRYLLDAGLMVTQATRTVNKAQVMIGDHPNGKS